MTRTASKLTLALAVIACTVASGARQAAAASQCLSQAEILDVAQMASVMAIGAALQRCGSCLGPRYQETLDRYETSHLLEDFRIAEAAITDKAKSDVADELVRQSARDYAYDLSADCKACAAAADTIDELATPDARAKLYKSEAKRVASRPELEGCN